MNIIPRIGRNASNILAKSTRINIILKRGFIGSTLRSRTATKTLYNGYYAVSRRRFSEKFRLNDGNAYNINPSPHRHGHGLLHNLKGWKMLIWSHGESAFATAWVWGSSVVGVVAMFWCIANSVCRDPEVRWRPHKKAWHFNDETLTDKYRMGAFSWYPVKNCRKRVEYLRKVQNEGTEDLRKEGQFGWEENPIPRLDD
eukprot:403955_1